MKTILLPIFLLISSISFAQAPCVPGTLTSPANSYILPDVLNHGCPNLAYNQIMYIKAAKDTTIAITTPISTTLTATIDSFVVDANIAGLPNYLIVESNPNFSPAAGVNDPKSNYKRLIIKGDSIACVKISGTVPAGTVASTTNLTINTRIYLSNIHAANPLYDPLIPQYYPNRKLDTTTSILGYQFIVDALPCYPASISNLDKYSFDLIGNAPNPFTGNTIISFQATKSDNYELKIMNATGAVVYNENVKSQSGMNYVNIDGSKLSTGMYMIVLSDNKNRLTTKMQVK